MNNNIINYDQTSNVILLYFELLTQNDLPNLKNNFIQSLN